MVPSFAVPPQPHFCFSWVASFLSSSGASGRLVIMVTTFPLLPLVDFATLAGPVVFGADLFCLQMQFLICLLQNGHISPVCVE